LTLQPIETFLLRLKNIPDFPHFCKFWSEISDLGSLKDQQLTLKFQASSKDPAKLSLFKKKQAQFYKLFYHFKNHKVI